MIFLLQTNSIQHQQMVAFFILYERLMNNQQMLLTKELAITVTMQGAPYAWAISHLAKSCSGSKVGYHPLARCKSCHAVRDSRCALCDSCCIDATYVMREAQKTVLCGSRKYPYPPTEGHWKFRGGGGFKGRNFRGEWGVHRKLIFQRVKKHEKIESNAQLMPNTK